MKTRNVTKSRTCRCWSGGRAWICSGVSWRTCIKSCYFVYNVKPMRNARIEDIPFAAPGSYQIPLVLKEEPSSCAAVVVAAAGASSLVVVAGLDAEASSFPASFVVAVASALDSQWFAVVTMCESRFFQLKRHGKYWPASRPSRQRSWLPRPGRGRIRAVDSVEEGDGIDLELA